MKFKTSLGVSKTISKEIALFLLAFCLAGGIINSTGIFQAVDVPNINATNTTEVDNASSLMDIDPASSYSANDLSAWDSWSIVLGSFSIIISMFKVLVLPGSFLLSVGVPEAFAVAIQVIVNVAEAWGLIQFATNRGVKQYE